jgi:hypothetical protein
MEGARTPFWKFSQKDAGHNGIPELFFPGIGVTYTIPLQPNFGSLFAF